MKTKSTVLLVITALVGVLSLLVYLLVDIYIGLIILFSSLLVLLIIVSSSKEGEIEKKTEKKLDTKPKLKIEKADKDKTKKEEVEGGIQISREFIIEGDLIGFSISIKNILDSQITNVVVRMQIPPSIKLDYNTTSKTFKIGGINPNENGYAKFYISQIGEDETVINATIEFKDGTGAYQITKIEPFNITSSKSLIANQIRLKEFTNDFEKTEYETLIIPLTEDLQEEKISEMIKRAIFMTPINDTREVLEMAGKTPSGAPILFRAMAVRSREGLQLYVSVSSKNQADRLSLLFDIKKSFKDMIRIIPEQFEDLSLD